MPGIPLAIARPDLPATLLDSNSKKTAFLQQAAIELALANISVHAGRVEQYHPSVGFSAITSRAFSDLADFVNLTRHLLDGDGRWLAMKGVWPHEEIGRLPQDIAVDAVHRLAVPGVDGERHLVIMKKAGAGSFGES
jgi:16S rRNA (guanine527-N7)-methyltransferase